MILGLDPGRSKTGFAFVDDGRQSRILSRSRCKNFEHSRFRGDLLLSGIFPTGDISVFIDVLNGREPAMPEEWITERPFGPETFFCGVAAVAVGGGTFSRDVVSALTGNAGDIIQAPSAVPSAPALPVITVDERGTTLEARDLYWRLHSPTLLQRCLPRGLRVPPRPLDDLAAWAIALRYIFDLDAQKIVNEI